MASRATVAERNAAGRLRQRLLVRILRRYALSTDRLSFAGVTLDFVRVAEPNRVLDEVAAEEDRREKLTGRRAASDELRLPYWAELWDSALGTALHLADEARQGAGAPLTILDLGCGMGLAGTVAAALGHRVMFADIEAHALLFAALNSLPWRQRVRTRRLNWQTQSIGERFDLILGADILYERAQWEHLEPFWRAHIASSGRVLLAEPGRPTGEQFPPWIENRGWRLMQHTRPLPDRSRTIRLFELSLA
jgi:predicted nicotinamide N-methyase